MSTIANNEDPDEMQHNAAFHPGLHLLLLSKQSSVTSGNSDLSPLKIYNRQSHSYSD